MDSVTRALQIAFINISLSLLSGTKSQNTEMGALAARDSRTASQYTNVTFGLLWPEEKKTVYMVAASTYHRLAKMAANSAQNKTQKSASILHFLFPCLKADGYFLMGL